MVKKNKTINNIIFLVTKIGSRKKINYKFALWEFCSVVPRWKFRWRHEEISSCWSSFRCFQGSRSWWYSRNGGFWFTRVRRLRWGFWRFWLFVCFRYILLGKLHPRGAVSASHYRRFWYSLTWFKLETTILQSVIEINEKT